MIVASIPAALAPRRTTTARRLQLALLGALVLGLVVAGPASADFFTPQNGGSPNADRIDTLYKLILGVAVVVFIGVEGALFYSLYKFKARKGAIPAQIRGNTRLEIGWTVGAAVILVVLATFTFLALPGIRNPDNSDADGLKLADGVLTAQVDARKPPDGKSLNVCVNGQQYIWRFTYDANCEDAKLNSPFAYEEMVVPVGTTVTLDIKGQDVAHSWWIPELGGKFDAIPGYTNHTWFKVPSRLAGRTFRGQCAELCGRNHANMTAQVKAVTPAEFETFIANRKQATKAADDAAAIQRKQFEREIGDAPAPTP